MQVFGVGDPNRSEHVQLVSDGSETCASVSDLFANAHLLRARGIMVHTIGVGWGYDAAEGGGTFESASDASSFRTALDGLAMAVGVCSAPLDGGASCVAGACELTCDPGYYLRGTTCEPDDSIAACGAACAQCPTISGSGVVACVSGICGVTCDPGSHLCGTACLADDRPASCGSSCTLCATAPNAQAICAKVAVPLNHPTRSRYR